MTDSIHGGERLNELNQPDREHIPFLALQYDLYGVATIFVSGLLLGYARLKTGSLYPTLFLHGLMNLIATVEVVVFLKVQR